MSCLAQQDLFPQQLPGMIQCGLGDFLSPQHSGNFLGAVFSAERLDGGFSPAVIDMFGNAEMMLTEFGDLG